MCRDQLRAQVPLIAMLVDDQSPEALSRTCRAEVIEIERQHWQTVALSDSHDGAVGITEVKIGKRSVEFDGTPQQPRGEIDDGVFARGDRGKKQARGVGTESGPE